MERTNSNQDKISNLEYFANLVGGNKDVVRDVIDIFLSQSVEEWNSLDNAVEQCDFERISKIAHGMKSTVSVMGAKVITPLLEEIQYSSKPGANMEQIKSIIVQLRNYYKKCTDEIIAERVNYI